MCLVVESFSEHVVAVLVAHNHHVFDPELVDEGILCGAFPVNAIVGGREAEFHDEGLYIGVIACIPHTPLVAFAEDPAAFADFGVPLSGLSGEQDFRVCVGKLLRRS